MPAHAIPQYLTNQTHSQNAGALGTKDEPVHVQTLAAAIAWEKIL